MKWATCDECMPAVDKMFALWVRSGNAGGLEAARIQLERDKLARWLNEHRRKLHSRIAAESA